MSTKVKTPFLTLVQGVAFGTVLSYKRYQSCKFRFETNGKMGGGHHFLTSIQHGRGDFGVVRGGGGVGIGLEDTKQLSPCATPSRLNRTPSRRPHVDRRTKLAHVSCRLVS